MKKADLNPVPNTGYLTSNCDVYLYGLVWTYGKCFGIQICYIQDLRKLVGVCKAGQKSKIEIKITILSKCKM